MIARRVAALLVGGTLVAGALAGCGDDPAWFEIAHVESSEPQAEPTPEATDAGAAAVRALATRHDGWTAAGGADVVWSPLATARALAMVRAGATGELAGALDEVLGDGGVDAVGAVGEAVRRDAGTTSTSDGTTAEVELGDATAVWGPSGQTWAPGYLDALARSFGASAWTVDVAHDPARAATELDAWAAARVGGEPGDLVSAKALADDDRLLVTSALSLAAPWATPASLGTLPFTSGDGATADVDVVVADGTFDVRRGDGWQAVSLPLAGGRFAVTVLLPDDVAEGSGLQVQLDELLGALAEPGEPEPLVVAVPAVDRRSRTDAGPFAELLGRPGADLVAMTDDPATAPRQVDGFFGEAVLALGPAGLNVDGGANRGAILDGIDFAVDRPFALVVHHVATGTPLLQALVTDLTSG